MDLPVTSGQKPTLKLAIFEELKMAGQGGPDEETWNKMTPGQKQGYWISVIAIAGIVLVLFIIKLFR